MAQLKEGKEIRTFRVDSGADYTYSELLSRMSRIVELLEPHQRNYHLCLHVNIYWYIEKHKEIELLLTRLARQSSAHLRHYLDELCLTISRKIEEDEKTAHEILSGKTRPK